MKRKLIGLAAVAAGLLVAIHGHARADTITLRDGTVIDGKIVDDTGKELVVETSEGKQTIKKSQALAIVRGASSGASAPAKADGAPKSDEKPAKADEKPAEASADPLPDVTKLEQAREGRREARQGRREARQGRRETGEGRRETRR